MPRRSSTNRFYRRLSYVILLIVMGILAHFVWKSVNMARRHRGVSDSDSVFRRYPGFGISLPQGYAIHGIDVSRYQKRVNWKLVKQMESGGVRLHFAFMKATEGVSITDPQFRRNWKLSREAGMVRGAYHFFRQDVSGAAQARHFIKTVSLLPGDLPPVLDVEVFQGNDREGFLRELGVWLRLVEQHYKVRPIIYTNASFYNNHLHPRFEEHPLWVAHYRERNRPRVYRQWHFWQHNEGGRVSGIDAFVDFNVFSGDSAAFRRLQVGRR